MYIYHNKVYLFIIFCCLKALFLPIDLLLRYTLSKSFFYFFSTLYSDTGFLNQVEEWTVILFTLLFHSHHMCREKITVSDFGIAVKKYTVPAALKHHHIYGKET